MKALYFHNVDCSNNENKTVSTLEPDAISDGGNKYSSSEIRVPCRQKEPTLAVASSPPLSSLQYFCNIVDERKHDGETILASETHLKTGERSLPVIFRESIKTTETCSVGPVGGELDRPPQTKVASKSLENLSTVSRSPSDSLGSSRKIKVCWDEELAHEEVALDAIQDDISLHNNNQVSILETDYHDLQAPEGYGSSIEIGRLHMFCRPFPCFVWNTIGISVLVLLIVLVVLHFVPAT